METAPESLLRRYCGQNDPLLEVLLSHSRSVADKALDIAKRHPELGADTQFLYEGAMLHDVGIVSCNAPDIYCYGTEPYIRHGVIGEGMLLEEGLERHARVAARHTGCGLSLSSIIAQDLPLPRMDLLPETIEEQIICFADKFFSKMRLGQEKTLEHARRSLEKFGPDGLERFDAWCRIML